MVKDKRRSAGASCPAVRKKFRPNFRRQMLYVGVTLAAIFGGYFLIVQLTPRTAAPGVTIDKQITVLQPRPEKRIPSPAATPRKRADEEALPGAIYEKLPGPVTTTAPPPAPKAALPPPEQPPWRRYAVKFSWPARRPLIAIVIDDMGVDQKRSARIIKLKAPLTLSFMTYANDLNRQTGLARARGHELMLHVAMEPISNTVDPGPNVLLTGLDDQELRRRLEWDFARFSGYVGINNHMGSKFTADRRAMALVMRAVKKRGLLFLDSRTSAATVAGKLARQMGVPLAERNIFIDNVNNIDAVKARLVEVEKMALKNGFVVAIGHPREATIEALEGWLKGIESKGFRLAPISVIIKNFTAP